MTIRNYISTYIDSDTIFSKASSLFSIMTSRIFSASSTAVSQISSLEECI